ncbi:type I restriction endonuclease subunit R [Gleimia hominis]|uniref:type I restriction endonuclease subunit R n=1 Tax=Gleimia hominis TaxID=595468 RepID=UPI000C7FA0F9|nr:type I restriction endonuclease subunit R [Gleimia hominis]WIK64285.1 type I restriction endonuclease subunit R [Gleimia hominis]
MNRFDESVVEQAALQWLGESGYHTGYGPDGSDVTEARQNLSDAILWNLVEEALEKLNTKESAQTIREALKRVQRAESQDVVLENQRLHNFMVKGVPVETKTSDGQPKTVLLRLIDFDNPQNNDWRALNQFTIIENGHNRRPDVLVFLNGLPVGLLELKNPANEHATMRQAWNQIQTYRSQIPTVFVPNVVTVISDGTAAAMSSFTGGFEHYAPWKTIEGREVITDRPALEVLLKGVFAPERFLDILRNFVVYSDEPVMDKASGQRRRALIKRVAKYHQYWAVNAAVESTVRAASPDGDRRGGVVWHTQGSGKSFEMVFYAAKLMQDPRMHNPTLVFITDRNDLDDQLFGEVFAPAKILPETPVQAEGRDDLRSLLTRVSGGIIFTTLHKFAPGEDGDTNPVLTDRRNVVVVADEAHRSQYGFDQTLDSKGRLKAGLAKHMRDALPNATFLGFTGTPIESNDRSTRAVFGDYIDVYDLTRAVEDGATVKIYYESRLAKINLSDESLEEVDDLIADASEGYSEDSSERAKTKWSQLEALVGADSRLDAIANDIVTHWEERRATMRGKAMIVTMSRRIAVELYEKIVKLRPGWHSDDLDKGKIKVVMTGSAADPSNFQPHIHSKDERRYLKLRAKNPDDELEIVIVRDMWLTGFDAPSMHTMYVDKPMQGAGLMQAIARVNRRFKDKPGGLIVDYIGLFTSLQEALSVYSPSDRDQAGVPIDELINVMLEKYDIVKGILHRVNYDSSSTLPAAQRLEQYATVLDFVLSDEEITKRYNDQVLALTKAHALVASRPEAEAISDDVRLFTDVRSAALKILNPDAGQSRQGGNGNIDSVLEQLVNESVTADEVVDVYKFSGMESPELSLLSDDFLDSIGESGKPNLQLGLLRRLLNDQIHTLQRTNLVQSRKFSEMLTSAVNRYTNRSLTTAEIIAELVAMAKDMRESQKRADELGLTKQEVALYDAVIQNDSAIMEMGDETLKAIARELVQTIRRSATIDWERKETVRARMRSRIKRLLAKYKYPPDKQDEAVKLIIEQAEHLASEDSLDN